MQKIPNGKYTKEFREEAVKLVTAKGQSIDEAAKRFYCRSSAHQAGLLFRSRPRPLSLFCLPCIAWRWPMRRPCRALAAGMPIIREAQPAIFF